MNFSDAATRILGPTSVAGALLVAACAPPTPAGFDPVMNPAGYISNDQIISQCIWTGGQEKITYVTERGNLYQVTHHGLFNAEIKAEFPEKRILVTASYNKNKPDNWQASDPTHLEITIRSVKAIDGAPDVALPAKTSFLSPIGYNFAITQIMAESALYVHREEMPKAFCTADMDLDSYRRPPGWHANVYSPVPPVFTPYDSPALDRAARSLHR